MSPRQRALIGAAVGAVLVLMAHPATRPGLLAAFRPLPRGGLAGLLQRPPLSTPNTLPAAAAYLHEAAERQMANAPLRPSELQTLRLIAGRGEAKDPGNPFWPLARFVIDGGQGPDAVAAFRRASQGYRYNDYQRQMLLDTRDRLARAGGDVQAWTYAAIAPVRSPAMVVRTKLLAIRTLHGIQGDAARNDFVVQAIRVGALLRDGSERLNLGRVGITLIERATDPPFTTVTRESETKRMYIAKTTFTAWLRAHGRTADAWFCDRQFRTNDSWQVLQSVEDPDERLDQLGIASVFVDTVPGAFLVAALVGTAIGLFGRWTTRLAFRSTRFHGAGLTAVSLALLTAGAALGFPLVGLMAGACALVPSLHPARPHRYDDSGLGPLHILVCSCLGVGLVLCAALAAVARSLPGAILPEQGPVGAYLAGWQRSAAAALVVLAATALVPPAWALVRRFPTPSLAAYTYRTLGRGIASTTLFLALIASPVTLALDRWIGDSLARIALNEQIYYNPSDVVER